MTKKYSISYRDAIKEALNEEMMNDESVYVLGEDVGRWGNLYGCTKGLIDEFGKDRVVDTPISEAAIAGCALGSSVLGKRPVAEIMYIDFLPIAMDQIINHMCKYYQMTSGKLKVPVVIRTQCGVGRRNSSQHSQSFENWFVNVPGMITVMPSTPYDVKGLLKSAIRNNDPVLIIEHKSLYFTKGEIPEEEYIIPLGKADIKKSGDDVTIVATSWMVLHALEAAENLENQGISCEVVDPRTIWPLDKETILKSVEKTKKLVVVTEAPEEGGWSGELSSLVYEKCFNTLEKSIKKVCGMRTGIPYGAVIEKEVVPNSKWIEKAVKELL